MLTYIIRRLLYAIPILMGVSLATFVLFYAVTPPEQIARKNISAKNPTPEQIKTWLKDHGYDRPLPEQFKKHMTEVMLFKFGNSDATGEPIWGTIAERWKPSFMVASLVFFAGLLTEVSFAVFVAYFRGTYIDIWGTFLFVLLMSISYMVYLIAGQFILGKLLKYWPLAGFQEGLSGWKFVMMPMVVGVISGLGYGVRLYRTFVLEEIGQDYVRTARAKGVPEQKVLFRHVLKNAAIPMLTSVVSVLPTLLMGSLLLESFFGIPGLGGMTVDAINSQDFAIVRAMVFLGSFLYIIGLILTDISYALVDPRVRLE